MGVTLRVWGSRYWAPPDAGPSYVGFLLDAARHASVTAGRRYLSRLARGGLSAWEFIVSLHRLGAFVPDGVLHRTANRLHSCADSTGFYSYDRVRAAESLAALGDSRGVDLLYAVARDTTLYGSDRVRAAEALGQLGDSRAVDLFHNFARNTTYSVGVDRVAAAESLVGLGDSRGVDLLYAFAVAGDTTPYDGVRVRAADALAGLGDSRGVNLLYALARDTALSGDARVSAAEALAGLILVGAGRRHPDGPITPRYLRRRRGAPGAVVQLQVLARDSTLYGSDRIRAAEGLAIGLGDSCGEDLLYALAHDTALDGDARVRAAEALAGLGDARGANFLT